MTQRLPPLLITTMLLLTAPVQAADWGPWQAPVPHSGRQASHYNPLSLGVRFFQKYISPVDGPRCPMYPTCSAYALEALHQHGPVTGSFLTVDRLLHELEPSSRREPIRVGDRIRYFDPLARNSFWLIPPPQETAPR